MEKIKNEAFEILDIAKNIYQISERTNPQAIFCGKTFIIGTEEDREAVSVEIDYEKTDSSYYFENPEIDGVIIKRKNGNYCVKASVKYTDELWFAKIRIEPSYGDNIRITGKWGGSWEDEDIYDEDLTKNPNLSFPAALTSMKIHLTNIYNGLCNNAEYDPEWVKKLKRYNT